MHGTAEERAGKILLTEWAIRDALTQGRDEARRANSWDAVPQANRAYIEDVIAHGTGRFRTPGFRSHLWTTDGARTAAAIASVNQTLAATGLRPLATTEVTTLGLTREGVSVDPEDWRAGRTQADVESRVTGGLHTNADSILLHSRIGASAAATPAVVADIRRRSFSFDPTAQGALGAIGPRPPFAGLSTISNPPTSGEIAAARVFFLRELNTMGPILAAGVAMGILQLAQRAGPAEVTSFFGLIRSTRVQTADGPVQLANWLNASEDWRVFAGFAENWITNQPFPRIRGVTL